MTMTEARETRSPVSPTGGVYGTYEKDRLENPMRMDGYVEDLEEGAMVVMYFGPGMLVVVKQNGKYWDLEPLSVPEDSQDMTLHFFPSEAVFTIVRKGRYIGFKSVVAEGRTLQAISAEENAPLRVNNYNFGAWEMWEPTGSGFVNRKWPQKTLNLEVCEIQTVSLDNLRKLERNTMKTSRDMQKQVKAVEVQRQKLEREIGDLNRTKRRQAIQHSREVEDSRARLDEALAAKQKLEVEGVQTGTKLRRQELLISQLTYQRDAATSRVKEIEANQRSEDRQVEVLKEKYDSDIAAMQRSHQSEVQALKKEKEAEVDRSNTRTHEELRVLRQKLEHLEMDRERELRRIQGEHENILRQRMLERDQLRDENHRLVQALQLIQQKVQHGFHAVNREEGHLSFSRNGCEDRIRSGAASPLQIQRFSPAPPSRNSNRRGEEFQDVGAQIERSALSSESLPRGYLERGTLGHYDALSTRSSLDYGHQRRADSRLSDNSKLNLQESRKQAMPVQAPNSARRASTLASSEVEEEQLAKEFPNKDYESETDGSGSLTEDLEELTDDKKQHETHRSLDLEASDDLEITDEGLDSESAKTTPREVPPTQPTELLNSSDISESMVGGRGGPTSDCLAADLESDESDDSENTS